MRIYYRGPDAVVTSELFVRRGSPPGRFAIRDLRAVTIASAEHDGAQLTTAIPFAAAAVLVGAAVIAAAGYVVIGATLGAVALAVCLACMVIDEHRPRRWELRARYRNDTVTLFSSSDERVFHQVSRALRRAIEETRPLGGVAAA
ncbi:DUF6232 family protein [Actinoplanes sp. CA-030573]|uniref:DUF6232 family protein n=1 Tax=Actinoplanes sp. CA-030573 TaxID=3239898 RepID=UPI003D902C9B